MFIWLPNLFNLLSSLFLLDVSTGNCNITWLLICKVQAGKQSKDKKVSVRAAGALFVSLTLTILVGFHSRFPDFTPSYSKLSPCETAGESAEAYDITHP